MQCPKAAILRGGRPAGSFLGYGRPKLGAEMDARCCRLSHGSDHQLSLKRACPLEFDDRRDRLGQRHDAADRRDERARLSHFRRRPPGIVASDCQTPSGAATGASNQSSWRTSERCAATCRRVSASRRIGLATARPPCRRPRRSDADKKRCRRRDSCSSWGSIDGQRPEMCRVCLSVVVRRRSFSPSQGASRQGTSASASCRSTVALGAACPRL